MGSKIPISRHKVPIGVATARSNRVEHRGRVQVWQGKFFDNLAIAGGDDHEN